MGIILVGTVSPHEKLKKLRRFGDFPAPLLKGSGHLSRLVGPVNTDHPETSVAVKGLRNVYSNSPIQRNISNATSNRNKEVD